MVYFSLFGQLKICYTKTLNSSSSDLTVEMTSLKENNSKLASKAADLKQSLFDEQINASDLKQKLKMSNKKVTQLKMEIKNLKKRPSGDSGSWLQIAEDIESSLERSQSLNDLGEEVEIERSRKDADRPVDALKPPIQKG